MIFVNIHVVFISSKINFQNLHWEQYHAFTIFPPSNLNSLIPLEISLIFFIWPLKILNIYLFMITWIYDYLGVILLKCGS